MCGIVGCYLGQDRANVEAMLAKILHRGPDGKGIVDTPWGILGHARLAIIDPARGHQPYGHDGAMISFNGEIYNYRQLAAQWLAGENLDTHSDTEVILRLFLLMGPRCVECLDGMFAFAILHEGQVFAARDPLGIKPLYYGEHQGVFHFASEVRALATVCRTVQEFPAGHWFSSESGWHRYYDIDSRIQAWEGKPEEVGPAIRRVLGEAVHKRLLADVPVGVSLSGGLDSSIISLCARQEIPDLHTFAVGMAGSGDIEAARVVADFLGTRHHELVYEEEDMQAVLPEVIHSLETFDPALVRSAFPNWFLAKLASREVKVMLTGEGADELYAGYDYLGIFREPESLQQELVAITGKLHNTNLQRADRLSMAFGLEARVPFLDVGSVSFALGLPARWKLHRTGVPKAMLREAYRGLLPDSIVERPKMKFSLGAGSSRVFWEQADKAVSDRDLFKEGKRMKREWDYNLPNKEALFYYRILRDVLPDEVIFPLMSPSRSL